MSFYTDLVSEVNAKAATGFPIQIVGNRPQRCIHVVYLADRSDSADRLLGTRFGRPPPAHAVQAQHVSKLHVCSGPLERFGGHQRESPVPDHHRRGVSTGSISFGLLRPALLCSVLTRNSR